MAVHTRTGSLFVALLLLTACGGGSKAADSKAPSAAQSTPLAAGLPAGQVQSSGDPRAALFLEKGCGQCHSIAALGVKSPNEIGPDLTSAYTDVQSRFGMELEQFLPNPTGTMQLVLGQMIKLSPAERDSILHILKRLHEESEERGEHSK